MSRPHAWRSGVLCPVPGSVEALKCCADGSQRGVVTVVVVLELGGRDESDFAVEAAVIEPVDVLSDGDLEVVDAPPGALVADEFGLEQELNASARALSNESPTVPMEGTAPSSASRWV